MGTFDPLKIKLTPKKYTELYTESIEDPNGFWDKMGHCIDWMRPYTLVKDTSFAQENFHIRWFTDGILNVSVNCLDRHLGDKGDQTAILWIGNEPGQSEKITYRQLYDRVCTMANALTKLGLHKGDCVAIYMPMIPDAAVTMLACARLGLIHSVVFGGFSAQSLASRIDDSDAKAIVTADFSRRGPKTIAMKEVVDEALNLAEGHSVRHVIVVPHVGRECSMTQGRDLYLKDALKGCVGPCEPHAMSAEDPLFILYTSGSTGKPKGVLHTSGGYLVYATLTFRYIFDYQPGDVFWCTADVGWVTGHSYVVYGPLSNGATTVMFEGVPNYPTYSRFWEEIDRHQVTIFYTAPTAIRALMKEGDDFVTKTKRTSLRVLGSVGEPLNHEAWQWYHDVVGNGKCPVVDTWWQTETGGILLSPLPGIGAQKPGSVTGPFWGIQPALLDAKGQEIQGAGQGSLVIKDSWPGQMRGVYKNPQRFFETYFTTFPGLYASGDGARRDDDGDYWITGRVDDVINVSGHRIGTAEVESAINEHPQVAESAVVGMPDDIKGQGIAAFIILKSKSHDDGLMKKEIIDLVRQHIGSFAKPDVLVFVPGLPKTRSGKIMRRILRKIAAGEHHEIGDTSTLAEPEVVQQIIDLMD